VVPIRLRLALWYGGLTGVVVVLTCIVVYTLHTRAHYDDVDRVLIATARHTGEEYYAARTERERAASLSAPRSFGQVVQVYDRSGRLVDASPNAKRVPNVDSRAILEESHERPYDALAALVPPLVPVEPGSGAFGLVGSSEGRWRTYVLSPAGWEGYVVAAAPLARLDASIKRFRWMMGLLTAVGAMATLTVGALLAGRALKPVATLTERAGFIARARDFSERVPVGNKQDELGRLAATFNEMLAALERAYKAEKRFVSDASHELRAPLTAIQGNLELLERHPDASPTDWEEAVRETSREARRLSQLVADLLALARADAGSAVRREKVELDRIVLEALTTARHLSRGQDVELAALEPALVEGDPDRLEELFLILLDNAIKYTPPGEQVILNLCRDDRSAEVTVRDTGVGIAPEDLPKVFERFYRADPARARDPGGTGLGLPIARWIAEAHGGEIELHSKPGKGTTVAVRLPLLRP
jgi:signal transduction histidine kinase